MTDCKTPLHVHILWILGNYETDMYTHEILSNLISSSKVDHIRVEERQELIEKTLHTKYDLPTTNKTEYLFTRVGAEDLWRLSSHGENVFKHYFPDSQGEDKNWSNPLLNPFTDEVPCMSMSTRTTLEKDESEEETIRKYLRAQCKKYGLIVLGDKEVEALEHLKDVIK